MVSRVTAARESSMDERPRRIMLVASSAKPGGAERALVSLARRLPATGWEATAVLLEDGPLASWLADATCPTVVLPGHRTRDLRRTAGTIRQLTRLVVSSQADVVLSSLVKTHIFSGLAAIRSRRPAVLWEQGIPEERRWSKGGIMVQLATSIPKKRVVVSCDDALAAVRRFTHAPTEKIPPGIDVDAVAAASGSGAPIRAALGWEDRTVVGIVGRLQEWKGQMVFLRAASALTRARPDLRFCVVGGSILGWEKSYERDVRAYAAQDPALAGKVHFAGHQDDAYAWMDALDVVVHASFGEPFGLVVVEAMALAKPLVATAGGGPSEIVEEGVSGLLVPQRDPEAIVGAVLRILDEDGLAGHLRRGGPIRARDFTETAMAVRFSKMLDDLVPAARV